eukprot:gnl/Dysnectes_brevis/3334_a4187_844.p1 GENE.gnl/Dysnectes_brevis/3334_a4187_844~~gnl/Dysnectes_brevis/3334_a4187_844.p1  ORF type:complete len:267 (+),score=74.25 gnl/Dysnectes_brevis/3334_a4187_844:708-1508(+)
MSRVLDSTEQVAGHYAIRVSDADSVIYKPLRLLELELYRYLDSDPSFASLKAFTPECHGIHGLCPLTGDMVPAPDHPTAEYYYKDQYLFIGLQNMLQGMASPCMFDLKMNTRTYGVGVIPRKVQTHSRKARTTTTGELGVRHSGMVVNRGPDHECIKKDKYYGRSLDVPAFQAELLAFLGLRPGLRVQFRQQVNQLLESYLACPKFSFFGVSLFVTFDYARDAPPLRMVLIDFAHSYLSAEVGLPEPDPGFVLGLRSLLALTQWKQ